MKGTWIKIRKNLLKTSALVVMIAFIGVSLMTLHPENLSAARTINGTITGTVFNSQVKPIANVTVSIMKARWDMTDGLAENPEWFEFKTAVTGRNGQYKVSVPAGTYKVWFAPAEADLTKYAREAYPDAPTVNLGDSVVVQSGKTTSRINTTLEQGIIISGKVFDAANGNPLNNIQVMFGFQSYSIINMSVGSVKSNTTGDYVINGLKPYPWIVWANTAWENDSWNDGYYDLLQYILGSPYNWPAELSETEVPIDLEPVGTINIQGRIVDDQGNPLSGVRVEVYLPDFGYWEYDGDWYNGDKAPFTTGADGTFQFEGIQSAKVRLYADGGETGYQSEFYYHAGDNIYGAQDIYLTRGVTSNIGDWMLFHQ